MCKVPYIKIKEIDRLRTKVVSINDLNKFIIV